MLTVDVECWGQSVLDRSLPILPHAADNVRRMLALFASVGARATLFVLGKFAERHPAVVAEARAAGHEIASHGYSHTEVYRLTPEAFRADLRRARDLIVDITGEPPAGFRAPVFSIGRRNLWALAVLAEEGYRYDASIFPFDGPRYGIGDWPTEPRRVELSGGRSIVEYPLSVVRAGRRRLPIAGGGYARLLPGAIQRRALRASAGALPPVFYCHPYEIDADEIRRCYPQARLRRRLHQGLGRRGFAAKLRRLVTQFECLPMGRVLEQAPALSPLRLAHVAWPAGDGREPGASGDYCSSPASPAPSM